MHTVSCLAIKTASFLERLQRDHSAQISPEIIKFTLSYILTNSILGIYEDNNELSLLIN